MWRRRTPGDVEFKDEIRAHLDLEADRLVSEGVSPQDAPAAAHRRFGNITAAQEHFYQSRRVMWLDHLRQDVRYGLRTFARNPVFTFVAVLTLALGIGANTAIFSVVNAVLLRSLPYRDADRLVWIRDNIPPSARIGSQLAGAPLPPPGVGVSELIALRSQARTLSHIGVWFQTTVTLVGRDEATRLDGIQLSPAILQMLGTRPLLGRMFGVEEEAPGAAPAIILSYSAWQRLFIGTPDVIGKGLRMDAELLFSRETERREYTVVGVMPKGFQFPDPNTEFWVPFVLPAGGPGMLARLPPMARLADGASIQTATEEINAILRALRGTGADGAAPPPPLPGPAPSPPPPVSVAGAPGLVGPAEPAAPAMVLGRWQDELVAPVRPAVIVLAVAVVFVLLIACVNVANLLLARTASRQREMAVRLALGAGRGRLIRQALTESVMLSLAGGVAGTGLAVGGIELLRRLGTSLPRRDIGLGVSIPRLDAIGVDGVALIFTVSAALLTGVLFGLAPAIRQSRSRETDALRGGAGASPSGFNLVCRNRMQGVLVIVEIAMAMILLIGGGLLLHSFAKLSRVNPGYDPTNILTFRVSFPGGESPAARIKFGEDLVARLESLTGVRSAGSAESLPMTMFTSVVELRTAPPSPSQAGQPPPPPAPPGSKLLPPRFPIQRVVSRDFLTVMGTRLIAGRGFGENDRAGQPQVLLINRALAKSGVLGDNPLGTQIYAYGAAPWRVVGIVDDIRQSGLEFEADPQVFFDFRQLPRRVPQYFVARTSGDPSPAMSTIRAVVRQLDPEAAIDSVATMEQIVSNSISRQRLYAVLLGIFAGIAVVLAAIGIYGLIAYAVEQRTRELGIRIALGARRSQVLGLVLRQGLVPTGIGVVAGICGAAAVTRYLDTMLFGLTPLDPPTFVAVSLMFVGVAMSAALVPARRATRVDPLVALRHE